MERPREIFTPKQAAEYLQVDKETIYRYIQQGKLVASKLGRKYRIPKRSDVGPSWLRDRWRNWMRRLVIQAPLSNSLSIMTKIIRIHEECHFRDQAVSL